MKRFLTISFTLLILVHTAIGSIAGQTGTSAPTEAQVKVAMIYNLAKFISWTEDILPTEPETMIICYLGSSAMTKELGLLQEKTVNKRALRVKEVTRIEDIGLCHILIVGPDFNDQLALIDTQRRQHGTLTVSDTYNFAARGGMIELFVEDDRVRFKINHRTIRAAQLEISSQVLQLATEVIE